MKDIMKDEINKVLRIEEISHLIKILEDDNTEKPILVFVQKTKKGKKIMRIFAQKGMSSAEVYGQLVMGENIVMDSSFIEEDEDEEN